MAWSYACLLSGWNCSKRAIYPYAILIHLWKQLTPPVPQQRYYPASVDPPKHSGNLHTKSLPVQEYHREAFYFHPGSLHVSYTKAPGSIAHSGGDRSV